MSLDSVDKHQSAIHELEQKLASKDAEEKSELAAMEKTLEQAQDHIMANESTIESLRKDVESKEANQKRLEADIERLVMELASKSDQLSNERESLRTECTALRIKLESLVGVDLGNRSPIWKTSS